MTAQLLSEIVESCLSPNDVGLSAAVRFEGVTTVATAGPVTPDTVFEVGSISKSMTAALVVLRAHEGRWRLDDPIVDHLVLAPPEWRQVTIRHLLDHRSGLAEYDDATTDVEAVESIATKPLRFPPGSRFEYRNANYCVLGALIAAQEGVEEGFRTALQRDVIDRFDLQGVCISDPRTDVDRALGYSAPGEERDPWPTPSMAWMADGPVMATASGMLDWVRRFWNREIVDPLDDFQVHRGRAYAAGWRSGKLADRPSRFHAGGVAGFESFMLHSEGTSIVVLANCDLSEPRDVAVRVLQAINGRP